MTQDKARKTATRQRMAETGEPYSVARHAVENEAAGAQGAADEVGGPSYVEQARDLADRARRRADEAQDRTRPDRRSRSGQPTGCRIGSARSSSGSISSGSGPRRC